MTDLTVFVALAAALAFGWSTAAMHYDASTAPASITGPFGLLRHLVGQWRWLTGMAASLLGLGLHALALRLGSLAVVQPLVVSGLVFSLLFRAALDRRWPSRSVMGWACFTAVGLALFLFAARSTTGSATPAGRATVIVLGVGSAGAALCWWAATRARPAAVGLLLGAGAGINFGLTAGALKATSAASSLAQVFTTWPLYVLLVLGGSGFLANQTAYRKAPLASSLPILNVANPVVALIFGVAAFGESPGRTPLDYVVATLSLTAVLAGVFFLARHDEAAPHPANHPVGPDAERVLATTAS